MPVEDIINGFFLTSVITIGCLTGVVGAHVCLSTKFAVIWPGALADFQTCMLRGMLPLLPSAAAFLPAELQQRQGSGFSDLERLSEQAGCSEALEGRSFPKGVDVQVPPFSRVF